MIRSLIFLAAVLFRVSAFTAELVVLPNVEILGASPTAANRIMETNSTQGALSPKEVRLVFANGVIDEIQALYSDKIQIEQIATAINVLYAESEKVDLRRENFRLWKVVAKKFVIQLSDYEGDRLLIFTRIKEATKRTTDGVPHKR